MLSRGMAGFTVLLLCALGAGAACAPSIRMVHESNTYFERCHAADLDPAVSVHDKLECWTVWLDHYTEGQPTHRILYARERQVRLAHGEPLDTLPGEEELDEEESHLARSEDSEDASATHGGDAPPPSEARGSPADTAEPDSAGEDTAESEPSTRGDAETDTSGLDSVGGDTAGGAPPTEGAGETDPGPEAERLTPRRPRYRGSPVCHRVCGEPWDRCIVRCPDLRRACVNACETEYRACMRGCF